MHRIMQWVAFIPSPSRRILLRAAHQDHLPVLITGETGAGKSRLAEWIHLNGPRSTGNLLRVTHRDALLPTLIGSGRSSTILLEDFHLWGEPHHTLLLQWLRSRSVVLEGVRHMIHARLILTMPEPFEEGSPLASHFQNLHLHLPPLAIRSEEFEDMALALLREVASIEGKFYLKGFDRGAWTKLKTHSWPGNLRELRNVIREAVQQSQENWILASDLPDLHLRTGIRAELKNGPDQRESSPWEVTRS